MWMMVTTDFMLQKHAKNKSANSALKFFNKMYKIYIVELVIV